MDSPERENPITPIEENKTVLNGVPLPPETDKEDAAYRKRHKRNVIISVICAAVLFVNLVFAAVIAVLDTKHMIENSAEDPERQAMYAEMRANYPDTKRALYGFPCGKNRYVIVPEENDFSFLKQNDIAGAVMTPNRRYTVFYDEDGDLYVTEGGHKNQKWVAENCAALYHLNDGALLYIGDDGGSYLLSLSDFTVKPYCKYGARAMYSHDLSHCLYADENGEIYIGSMTDKKVCATKGSPDAQVMPSFVSDNGRLGIWMEREKDKTLIRDYDDGTVAAVEMPGLDSFGAVSADRNGVVLMGETYLYLKIAGRPAKLYRTEGRVDMPYTDFTVFDRAPVDKNTPIYFNEWMEDGDIRLHYIAPDGEDQVILTTDGDGEMANGYYTYSDTAGNIMSVKVEGDKVGLRNVFLHGVSAIHYSDGRSSILYYVDDQDRTYCYDGKDGTRKKVFDHEFDGIYLSEDGTSALLVTDSKTTDGGYPIGCLWYYDFPSNILKQIGNNVIIDETVLGSGYEHHTLDPDAYFFYEMREEKDGVAICSGNQAKGYTAITFSDNVMIQ